MNKTERDNRVKRVNALVKFISQTGRKFFQHNGHVAYMIIGDQGRLYWIDHYTHSKIYLHYKYWRKGFTGGGTLKQCVELLKRYVMTGEKLHPNFFNDHWGYGDDMVKVLELAQKLELVSK